MKLEVIILAAGKGTRMHSQRPKVLHEIAGRAMLSHVLDCATAIAPERIHIVIGHGADAVREHVMQQSPAEHRFNWVVQEEQLGTGHAVTEALSHVGADAHVLVLYGDVPLIQPETISRLAQETATNSLALLTATLEAPDGYGRIVRDSQAEVVGIVEDRDATDAEREIREINTGFMAAQARPLGAWLQRLDNRNAKQEFYLTDIVGMAAGEGAAVCAVPVTSNWEITGVNARTDLARIERIYQERTAHQLMETGLTLKDPARFDLRGSLDFGRDCEIDINVVLEGSVVMGDDVCVGPNCLIRNCVIGSGVTIHANSVLDAARIGDRCSIGPFARVRPDTALAEDARVGNFVEVKKSNVGRGSKINHLAYVGDSEVGSNVNIGAGVITCNYDGANKHRTVIGDDVFIGSDCQLVAPVTIGAGATIGAGSTINRDAPEGKLTLTRVTQKTIQKWKRPTKKSS